MLQISVSPNIENRFNFLVKETRGQASPLLQEAFYKLMEDLEDIYEANEVLKTYDPKESVIWTLEDLDREIAALNVAD
jgi:predicted DNA-binding protein